MPKDSAGKRWPADKVDRRAVADLIPYARNSRTHSDAQVSQIAASIKEWGWTVPILIDAAGGIIAGHGRILAAHKLGITDVPCMVAEGWTEAQKRAYVIADNKLALNAGWDDDLLKVELGELGDLDFDLSLTGFDEGELADLFPDDPTEGLTDEDEAPEAPEIPATVEGDVWLLGNHRLMCGDSTSVDAVDRLMDGRKADCVLTDPPYNQKTQGGFTHDVGAALKRQSQNIEHMCDFDPGSWLPVVVSSFPKRKMNATVFCNKDLVPQYLNWARDCGYVFNILVWKKPSGIPLGGSYTPDVEYCLVLRRSATFNKGVKGVSYSKVLEHKREAGLHPTMKPVGMLENQIKIVSNSKDVILDFFGGSGSTLIACEKTARDCRMMELDPKYCDVIVTRWQDFTGKSATLESDGRTFDEIKADRLGAVEAA